MSQNAICGWDFTLFTEAKFPTIISELKVIAKKWVFQEEKGEGGRVHFQGRLSLVKKKRLTDFIRLIGEGPLKGAHLSPTTKTEFKAGSFNYVMKKDTRLNGPWCDTDVIEEVKEPPSDVKESLATLYPWQNDMIILASIANRVNIEVIVDIFGLGGKTTLIRIMKYNKTGINVPAMDDSKRMMEWCCAKLKAHKKKKEEDTITFIIDCPRSLKKDKMRQFWSGVETIKTGILSDTRYTATDIMIEIPNIIVFTNTLPEENSLTKGRIRMWMIDPETRELFDWTPKRWENACKRYAKASTKTILPTDMDIEEDTRECSLDDYED